MTRRPRLRTLLSAAAVVLAGLTAPALRAADPPPAPAWRTFVDVDGKPLPFKTDAELLEFLRTAEPPSETHLSGGINFPRKGGLEKDGLKVSASPWGPDDEIGRLNWITPETNAAIDGRGAASHSPQPVRPPARTRTRQASWLPSPISWTSGIDR